jgi:pyruvate dehydrogenase E1 component beta subunit
MSLYNTRGEVPDGDYTTPIGQAAVRRPGRDLTIIGVSRQALLAGIAAQRLEEEDVDAEVIDLRSLRPIDWRTLTDSIRRTNRCLVVEDGWTTYGIGAEIAAGLQDRAFDDLDAPVRRLGGAEVPMPYNKEMERAAIPSVDDIVREALRVVGKRAPAAV